MTQILSVADYRRKWAKELQQQDKTTLSQLNAFYLDNIKVSVTIEPPLKLIGYENTEIFRY
jgi:hypothetical protein